MSDIKGAAGFKGFKAIADADLVVAIYRDGTGYVLKDRYGPERELIREESDAVRAMGVANPSRGLRIECIRSIRAAIYSDQDHECVCTPHEKCALPAGREHAERALKTLIELTQEEPDTTPSRRNTEKDFTRQAPVQVQPTTD